MEEAIISLGVLVAYFAILIYIVLRYARMKEDTMEEFAVGGRKYSWIFIMFTIIATFIPGAVFVGWFSWCSCEGLIAQYLLVYTIGGFFVFYMLSGRVYEMGKKFKLLTQPDFIKLRYRFKPLSILFSIGAVLIEAPWVILEFAAIGFVVHFIMYGLIPTHVGTVIVVLLILTFIYYRGMHAVIITDLFQGIISAIVILGVLVAMVYFFFGGFSPMYQSVAEVAAENLTVDYGGAYPFAYWSSIIITGTIGAFVWASMFNRIFSAKNVRAVKFSCAAGGIVALIWAGILMMTAVGGYLLPGALDAGQGAFFWMLGEFGGPVLIALGGIVVIAAVMSLVDSVIVTHATIISENLLKEVKPGWSVKTRLMTTRITVVIYVLVALAFALMELPTLALIAIAMYEGIIQLFPPILFGLYWRRSNKYGAFLGLVAGLAIAIYLGAFPETTAIFGWWTGAIVAIIVNVAIHVTCGFLKKPEPYVNEIFESMRW